MRTLSGVVVFLFAAGLTFAQASPPAPKCPPPARIDTAKDTYGTTVVADPYRWLEDQDSPRTRTWIEEQTLYARAYLASIPGRERIRARIRELLGYHGRSRRHGRMLDRPSR